MTQAEEQGSLDHLGWDTDRYALAAIYDAINLNTRATGNWGKGKAPKFKPFYRPSSKKSKKKAVSKKDVADGNALKKLFARFAGGAHG